MNKKAIILIAAIAVLGLIVFYSMPASLSIEQSTDSSSIEVQPVKSSYEESLSKPDVVQTADAPDSPAQLQVRASASDHNQVEEKSPSSQHKRIKMAERLEPILQEGLSGEGFSQYEIDITAKEVIYEYKKLDGTINFSKAVNRAAEALNFDDERRNKLSIAVLKSAAQSVEITFDQWNQCLNYRVKTMSQCVQDIAQDLSRSVAAVTGQSLLGEERSKILNLSKQAMADAVKQCEITAEEADRVLRVVLSDCP